MNKEKSNNIKLNNTKKNKNTEINTKYTKIKKVVKEIISKKNKNEKIKKKEIVQSNKDNLKENDSKIIKKSKIINHKKTVSNDFKHSEFKKNFIYNNLNIENFINNNKKKKGHRKTQSTVNDLFNFNKPNKNKKELLNIQNTKKQINNYLNGKFNYSKKVDEKINANKSITIQNFKSTDKIIKADKIDNKKKIKNKNITKKNFNHIKNKLSLNIEFINKKKNINRIPLKSKINKIIKSQNCSPNKKSQINKNNKIKKNLLSKNTSKSKIKNNNIQKKSHKKNSLSMPFESNTNKIIKDLKLPIQLKQGKFSMTPDISRKNTIIEKSNENSFVSYIIQEESISNDSEEILYEQNNSKTKRNGKISKSNSYNSNKNLTLPKKVINNKLENQLNNKELLIKKIKKFTKFNKNEIMKTSLEFYNIKKLLGKGSYGKVYLAESVLGEKEVAIKCFDKSKIKSKTTSNKIFQEIMILKQLNGFNNIIKLFEIFENKNFIFIVLEYMKDGDLFSHLKNKGAWKKDKVLIIFRQLIKGLENIHNNQIIHRDIKLDNILLDLNDLKIKIADFGVSKIIKDKNKMIYDFIGTPAYLAPEIISGKGYKGFSSDIWSLGISIYFLLYGNVPFSGDDIDELYSNIQNETFTYNDKIQLIENDFKEIINSMLIKDYTKRITIEELLKNKYIFNNKKKSIDNEDSQKIFNLNIVNKIQKFGFDYDEIFYTLENNKINHIFALYNLLNN